MTAVLIDDIRVETVEGRAGTAVLTSSPAGFEIIGRSKIHRAHGEPQTYVFRVDRCDCRDNPDSTHRHPLPRVLTSSQRRNMSNGQRVTRNEAERYANTGSRELCLKPCGHNSFCYKTLDHCASNGHEDKVRALFDGVVKTYRSANVDSIWSRL